MSEYYVNTTKTTLSANYTAGDGVINVVTTAAPFPQFATFRLAILNTTEDTIKVVLKVTAVNSSTQWAVTAEGTDANASSGDHVVGTWWTSGALDQIRADLYQSDVLANLPAANLKTGLQFLPTDGIYQYRYNGGSFDRIFRDLYVLEPNSGSFSWINQGSATLSTSAGGFFLDAVATSGDQLRIREKAAPTAPFTVDIGMVINSLSGTNAGAGIAQRESGSGKVITFNLFLGNPQMSLTKWNSVSSFNANYSTQTIYTHPVFFRVHDDATNVTYSCSSDGRNYLVFATRGRTDFCTPDKIGVFANSNSSTYDCGIQVVHYKES